MSHTDWIAKTGSRKTPAQIATEAAELADKITGCNLPSHHKDELHKFLLLVVKNMNTGIER